MNKPKYKVPTQPIWAKAAAVLAYAGAKMLNLIGYGIVTLAAKLSKHCLQGSDYLLDMQKYMEELRV